MRDKLLEKDGISSHMQNGLYVFDEKSLNAVVNSTRAEQDEPNVTIHYNVVRGNIRINDSTEEKTNQ